MRRLEDFDEPVWVKGGEDVYVTLTCPGMDSNTESMIDDLGNHRDNHSHDEYDNPRFYDQDLCYGVSLDSLGMTESMFY